MKTQIKRIEEDMLIVITEVNEFVDEKMWIGELTINQGVEIDKYIREYTAIGLRILYMLQQDYNRIL